MKNIRIRCLLTVLLTALYACQLTETIPPVYDHTNGAVIAKIRHPDTPKRAMDVPLKIVSFNIHGPQSNPKETLQKIRDNHLKGDEQVLCLQEVLYVSELKEVFAAYPYQYITRNETTRWDWSCFCSNAKSNNIAILSKLPILEQHNQLIQVDPGGDRWQRHAQYVRIRINKNTNIRLFHIHNTYNWNKDNSKSEKAGMEKFVAYIEDKLGRKLSKKSDKVFLAGDFNLSESKTTAILGNDLTYQFNGFVDYVVSTNTAKNDGGIYNTAPAVSDHDAVWASYELDTTVKK